MQIINIFAVETLIFFHIYKRKHTVSYNISFLIKCKLHINDVYKCEILLILGVRGVQYTCSSWNFKTYKFSLDNSNEKLQLLNAIELPLQISKIVFDGVSFTLPLSYRFSNNFD